RSHRATRYAFDLVPCLTTDFIGSVIFETADSAHLEPELRVRAITALVALHVSVALFGFAALFGKWIALSPVGIVFGRTVVAAITLAIVLRWTKHVAGSPNRVLVINGALLALHWLTFFAAIRVAAVAVGLLGFASVPVFVVLLARGF